MLNYVNAYLGRNSLDGSGLLLSKNDGPDGQTVNYVARWDNIFKHAALKYKNIPNIRHLHTYIIILMN